MGGVWRTVMGRRVFINEGQDLQDAMNKSGRFDDVKWDYRGITQRVDEIEKEPQIAKTQKQIRSLYNAIERQEQVINSAFQENESDPSRKGDEKALYTARRRLRQLRQRLLNKGMNDLIRGAAGR